MFGPILASVLQATSFTLDKAVLNLRKVDYRRYTLVSFPLIAMCALALMMALDIPLRLTTLSTFAIGLIIFTITHSAITNVLFYRSLQHDHLNELELWHLAFKIPLILGTAVLFADERNILAICMAIIAALAVLWAHWNHTRLVIRRTTAPYILWALVMAPFATAATKLLLRELHPVALETIRTVPLAVLFASLYHGSWRPIGAKSWAMLLATNALTVAAGVLVLFSYQTSGIIYTSVIITIQPLLVYFFAIALLGERRVKRKLIAFVIVLAAIAIAQLAR